MQKQHILCESLLTMTTQPMLAKKSDFFRWAFACIWESDNTACTMCPLCTIAARAGWKSTGSVKVAFLTRAGIRTKDRLIVDQPSTAGAYGTFA